LLRTPVAIRTTTDTAHRENFASCHPSYGLLTRGLLFVPFAGCILLSSSVPGAVGPGFGMIVAPAPAGVRCVDSGVAPALVSAMRQVGGSPGRPR
jgi:hypothetical protein